MNKAFLFVILFLFSHMLSLKAYAYAGPGAAIGAIIVFLTVIFAFLASIFLKIFNFFKFKKKQSKKVKTPKKNK